VADTSIPTTSEATTALRAAASPLRVACLLFVALFGSFVALLLASAALFAQVEVLLDPTQPGRLHPVARFVSTLALVLAYTGAAAYLGRRWVALDFDALRPVIAVDDGEWRRWRAAMLGSDPRLVALGAGLGLLAGVTVNVVADWLGAQSDVPTWRGLVVWTWLMNPALFAVMGLLVAVSAQAGRIFVELGRRARVSLLDTSPLAPFARAGLQLAGLWLVGSSLATLLFLSSSARVIVAVVLVATLAIAVLSLLLPSRGVHERLGEAKRAELAWVRNEIERGRTGLVASDSESAMRLPALLAWEQRVEAASDWPFDTATWLRFALILLLPLGSWLGGALVERVVNSLLG
jgi:hypothetical protein